MTTAREELKEIFDDAATGKITARVYLLSVMAILDKLDEVEQAIRESGGGKGPKPPK